MLNNNTIQRNSVSDEALQEPIFRDVPYDESEWRPLYEILRQVSQPKAELMRAQYEKVRVAYQNYFAARDEEKREYATRRVEDEAYNQTTLEKRRAIEAEIRAIRDQWRALLNNLRTELEQARREAYQHAGEAGINLRGDAILGIGLDDKVGAQNLSETSQASESASPDASPSHVPDGATPQPAPNAPTPSRTLAAPQPTPNLTVSLGAPAPWAATPPTPTTPEPQPSDLTSLAAPTETPQEPAPPTIEPLTHAEAAHDEHLPTAKPRVAFGWLHWLAPSTAGVLIGQVLLAALQRGLGDWQDPLFWIASVAGALAMLAWYRALWNASRVITELYYLFNWGAVQARRIVWLSSALVLTVLIFPSLLLLGTLFIAPFALLLSAVSVAPSVWETPPLLSTLLVILLMVPLGGLALTGGYLHGRQELVDNAVEARVAIAQREYAIEERERLERERQEREQREQETLEQAQGEQADRESPPHQQHEYRIHLHYPTQPTSERERAEEPPQEGEVAGVSPYPERETAGSNASSPYAAGVASPNGGSVSPSVSPVPPTTPSIDPQERLRTAFAAVSKARAATANYQQAKEEMEHEIALLQRELAQLQLRPIYPDLPPHAKERLRTLYGQWRKEFVAFLDTVAEAFRDCKDGEQVAQQIADYKAALLQ